MNDRFDWTSAAVKRLRDLWLQGLPTAEIGRLLGVSKNAVTSKVDREGLPGRPSPIRRGGQPAPRRAPRASLATLPPLASAVAPAPRPVAAVPIVAAVSRPCCFPLWGEERPTHRYCGEPGIPGKPYCPAHARKVYSRPEDVPFYLHSAAPLRQATGT